MKTDFKTYKRKIIVRVRIDYPSISFWEYAWSTNAYKTCKEAVAAAKIKEPTFEFRASFSRD